MPSAPRPTKKVRKKKVTTRKRPTFGEESTDPTVIPEDDAPTEVETLSGDTGTPEWASEATETEPDSEAAAEETSSEPEVQAEDGEESPQASGPAEPEAPAQPDGGDVIAEPDKAASLESIRGENLVKEEEPEPLISAAPTRELNPIVSDSGFRLGEKPSDVAAAPVSPQQPEAGPREQSPEELIVLHDHLRSINDYGMVTVSQFCQYSSIGGNNTPHGKACLDRYVSEELVERTWLDSQGRYVLTNVGKARLAQLAEQI